MGRLRLGQEHGIDAPVNQFVTNLIHAKEPTTSEIKSLMKD